MRQVSAIFGIILVFTILINPAFAITQLDRVDITNPRLVDAFDKPLSKQVNVNQQVQISADIKNNQEKVQDFTFIIQVKNQNNVIISLGFISGSLSPGKTISPAISWIPKASDEYTVEIFVWNVPKEKDRMVWEMAEPLTEHTFLKITS